MKPGFIAPPWPHTPGDSVCALSLVQRVSAEAIRSSGLYAEIYEYRALCELHDILARLTVRDAETFNTAAASQGFHLTASALDESREAYNNIMNEIRNEQI